jgi:hypothetical protein
MPIVANKFVVVGKEMAAEPQPSQLLNQPPQPKNLQEIRQILLEAEETVEVEPNKKISQYVIDMYNTADGLISFDK